MSGKGDIVGLGGSRLPEVTRVLDAARLVSSPHAVSWNQSQLLTVHASEGAGAAYNIPMSHWVSSMADLSPCRASHHTCRGVDPEDGAFVSGRHRGSPCGAAHDV